MNKLYQFPQTLSSVLPQIWNSNSCSKWIVRCKMDGLCVVWWLDFLETARTARWRMDDWWFTCPLICLLPQASSVSGRYTEQPALFAPLPPLLSEVRTAAPFAPSSPHFQSYSPTSTSLVKNLHIRIYFMDPKTLGDDYKGKVNPSVLLASVFFNHSSESNAQIWGLFWYNGYENHVNRKTIGNEMTCI